MQTVKISLGNTQGRLSRIEMKQVLGGNQDETIGGDGCVKLRGKCSAHTDCCDATHACINIDGETGSNRCNK